MGKNEWLRYECVVSFAEHKGRATARWRNLALTLNANPAAQVVLLPYLKSSTQGNHTDR